MLQPPPPGWAWGRSYGNAGYDLGLGTVADGAGNTYTIGGYQGPVTFGATTLPAQGADVFIVKHNPTGGVDWARHIGGNNADDGGNIAIGNSGDIYVTGTFLDTVVFDATTTLISEGERDIFVASYSATGAFRWAKRIGGNSFEALPVLTASGNRVIVTGSFTTRSMTIGSFVLTTPGNYQLFVASLDGTDGSVQWAMSEGGSGDEYATGVEAAPNGDVLISGRFIRSTTLAGSTHVSAGNYDAFLLRVSAQGVSQWSRVSTGGTDNDRAYDVAIDATGNIYLVGFSVSQSITFGSTTLPGAGQFLVKFDAAGNQQWARALYHAYGTEVAVSRTGDVYVGGTFVGTVIFGTSTLVSPMNTLVPFVAQYDGNGQAQWGQMPANPGPGQTGFSDEVYGLTVDLADNVYVTGSYASRLRFGSNTFTTSGGYDIFLAKLASPCALNVPTVSANAVCAGQTLRLAATNIPSGVTLLWSGPNGFSSTAAMDSIVNVTAAASGTYVLTITSASLGCSVGAGVAVNVEEMTTPTITQTGTGPITLTSSATSGNQWYFGGQPISGATGPTYVVSSSTQNGPYTVVATSASGCVSAPAPTVNVSIMAAPADLPGLTLELSPNPSSNGRVVITLAGYDGRAQLTVNDALGRLLHTQRLVAANGTPWQRTLDMEHWPAGLYLLRVQSAAGVFTRRLVRE
jgi:hypothetical protein